MKSTSENQDDDCGTINVIVGFDTPNTFRKYLIALLGGFPFTHVRLMIPYTGLTQVIELCHEGLMNRAYYGTFYFEESCRNVMTIDVEVPLSRVVEINDKVRTISSLDISWSDLSILTIITKQPAITCTSMVSWLLIDEVCSTPSTLYRRLTNVRNSI